MRRAVGWRERGGVVSFCGLLGERGGGVEILSSRTARR